MERIELSGRKWEREKVRGLEREGKKSEKILSLSLLLSNNKYLLLLFGWSFSDGAWE